MFYYVVKNTKDSVKPWIFLMMKITSAKNLERELLNFDADFGI